jgi:hypothetical protein
MFLARKNNVSVAFFSDVHTLGNKTTLPAPDNVDFLYHILSAFQGIDEVDLAIHQGTKNTIKLSADLSGVDITDSGIEVVIE